MVREVLHLQVGQCGNQIGTAFWNDLIAEHKIDKNGKFVGTDEEEDRLEKIDVFFRGSRNDKRDCRWVPRAICVDLEPGVIDALKNQEVGGLFREGNMKYAHSGAGNVWARGFHGTEGMDILQEVLDTYRQEMEACDCLQGTQIFHSLGGGTGSGFGTRLLSHIHDEYQQRITVTYSVYPNTDTTSDIVVDCYNAVFSTHQLLEAADETFIIDNSAMFSIATKNFKMQSPNFASINKIISQGICGVTSGIRFPGKLTYDYRKLATNLIPFERNHFFLISQAPLAHPEARKKTRCSIKNVTRDCWDPKQFFCKINPDDGKFLALSINFRGRDISTDDVDKNLANLDVSEIDSFVEWIPNHMTYSIADVPPDTSIRSSTLIGNTTAVKNMFEIFRKRFHQTFKRRGFINQYITNGVDLGDFENAIADVRLLIDEYELLEI